MRLKMSLWAEGTRIFLNIGIVHDSPDVCVDDGLLRYAVGEVGVFFAETVGAPRGVTGRIRRHSFSIALT